MRILEKVFTLKKNVVTTSTKFSFFNFLNQPSFGLLWSGFLSPPHESELINRLSHNVVSQAQEFVFEKCLKAILETSKGF